MLSGFLSFLFTIIALICVWELCHGDIDDFLFFIVLFVLLMIFD